MQVILAQPRGFCAGVKRAIKIVSRAIEVYGAPLYVRHEIVHNRTVVEELKAKGAIFVDDISQVPDGATLIFSAHGVPAASQTKPTLGHCAFLTPPVLWSPKCTVRSSSFTITARKSS